MTIETGNQELEDILNEYVASPPGPGTVSLAEWIRRYPQYEQELTEFTVNWSVLKWMGPSSDKDAVPEETLVLRGMSVVQDLLFLQKREQIEPSDVPTIQGILVEGQAQGLTIAEIANQSQLSIALVRKLDRRLIRPANIPHQAIEGLAHALKIAFFAVARYLHGPPRFPSHAKYHAEQAPMLAEPEDFFVAVRNDQTMPEELRKYWLSFAPSDR